MATTIAGSQTATGPPVTAAIRNRLIERVAFFAALLLIAVGSQILASAYKLPMGGHPDEPGHFLGSVMVRDYLLAGVPSGPMSYAEQYYAHYPAIAIGYWPPLFYLVAGGWMVLFGISRVSALLLMAVICASLQYLLFRFGEKEFRKGFAFALAAVVPFIPAVTRSLTMVMSDLLLASLAFAATLSFGYYLARPTIPRAALFGVLSSAAILTKASAIFLIPLPVIAVLLSRKFKLVRRMDFWIPVPVLVVLCGPWYALTHQLSTRGLLPGGGEPFFSASVDYVSALVRLAGPVVLTATAIGAVLVVIRAAHPVWYAITALPLCVGLVLSLAPVGIETRYCFAVLPCLLLLFGYALRAAFERIEALPLRSLILVTVLASLLSAGSRVQPERARGLAPALNCVDRLAKPDSVILVSSVNAAEVLIVADLAARDSHRPSKTIVRANKLLAAADWNMTRYRLRFQQPEQVLEELRRKSIDMVLVSSPGTSDHTLPHHELLLQTLAGAPEEWRLVYGGAENPDSRYRVYVPVDSRRD